STTVAATGPAGIGDVATLNDGAVARVNSVAVGVPPLDEFGTPDDGNALIRLDVEEGAANDKLSSSSLYWAVQMDDNTMSSPVFAAQGFQTITLAPGNCQRGTIDVQAPQGRNVKSVVRTDELLSEEARWPNTPGTDVKPGALSSGVTPAAV